MTSFYHHSIYCFYKIYFFFVERTKIYFFTVGKRYASDENVKRLETWLSEPNQDLREGASRVLLLVAQWIEESALRALLERMLSVTLDRVEQNNANR